MCRKVVLPLLISLVFILLLFRGLDWSEVVRLFNPDISLQYVVLFMVFASTIVWMYGLRWNWLLGGALRAKTYVVASMLSMGGNMFLPARGGDLLRVHYSHIVGQVLHATALSRLLIEKIIDLYSVALVGVLALFLLNGGGGVVHNYFLGAALGGLAAVTGAVLFVKFGNAYLLRWLHRAFNLFRSSERFERNLAHLIRDIGQKLTLSLTLKPGLLTIAMWLVVYVPSYMLIARMVGVNLAYHESMLVLFAAALGLMIPAAPSGVGTFHASVVSAFIFLGRPAAEGLLVGTAIHLFFLIAYGAPAALLTGVWFFKREALR
jgi:hypothetical protein